MGQHRSDEGDAFPAAGGEAPHNRRAHCNCCWDAAADSASTEIEHQRDTWRLRLRLGLKARFVGGRIFWCVHVRTRVCESCVGVYLRGGVFVFVWFVFVCLCFVYGCELCLYFSCAPLCLERIGSGFGFSGWTVVCAQL